MKLKNETYDLLKRICTVWLPALATLVIALGKIWGWEHAPMVSATITAVATCLGTILNVSSSNYWNGLG